MAARPAGGARARTGQAHDLADHHVHDHRQAHVERGHAQVGEVPVAEVLPPAGDRGLADDRAQPVEAALAEQVADGHRSQQAADQQGQRAAVVRGLVAAQQRATGPQCTVRRQQEPIRRRHAVVRPEVHALATDHHVVDRHRRRHEQRERPARPAAQVVAADEERGPAGIGQRADVAERGGQVQAGEDQQGGDQRHHEGALRSGVHQARFRRLSPAFYRSRPVGGRRAGAIMSA